MRHHDVTRDTVRLPRGVAEQICLLHAIGHDGCPADRLAPRLGLSPTLAPAVASVTTSLAAMGLVEADGARIVVTGDGWRWYAEWLEAVGMTA